VGFLVGSHFSEDEAATEIASEGDISPLESSTSSGASVMISPAMLAEEREGDMDFADLAKTAYSLAIGESEKGSIVFYKFFEQCLANFCDGRLSASDMNQPRETKDFLSRIKTALNENLELSSSIMLDAVDDSICFVKDFGDAGILLILMPAGDRESLRNIACVSLFECARPTDRTVFLPKEADRPVIEAVDSFEHFVNGSLIFSRGQLEFGFEFIPSISQAYQYARGKSIYFAILNSSKMLPRLEDFKEILNAASKSSLDIDITRYLNVDALMRARGIRRFV
jgi:hypothetical protein